ncbi:MAG: tetratricopeptide repeat protein, partial [Flavobacteriales bacterium]
MENKEWQRALELQKNHNHEEAIELFNSFFHKESSNPDLLHDRGVSYFHLKRKQECLADFESAANIQPDYAYRYSSMAFIKAAFNMTEEALRDYNKAVELDPTDAVTQNNLGLLEEQLGWKKE